MFIERISQLLIVLLKRDIVGRNCDGTARNRVFYYRQLCVENTAVGSVGFGK